MEASRKRSLGFSGSASGGQHGRLSRKYRFSYRCSEGSIIFYDIARGQCSEIEKFEWEILTRKCLLTGTDWILFCFIIHLSLHGSVYSFRCQMHAALLKTVPHSPLTVTSGKMNVPLSIALIIVLFNSKYFFTPFPTFAFTIKLPTKFPNTKLPG